MVQTNKQSGIKENYREQCWKYLFHDQNQQLVPHRLKKLKIKVLKVH